MMGYNDKESNSHLQAVSAPSTDLHHSRSLCFWLHNFARATIQLFADLSLQLRSASDLPFGGKTCVPYITGKVTQWDQITWSVKTKQKTTFLSKAFPSAPCSQAFIWLRCCWSVCPTVEMLCSSVRVCARSSALCVSWICARTPHTTRAPPLLSSSCYLWCDLILIWPEQIMWTVCQCCLAALKGKNSNGGWPSEKGWVWKGKHPNSPPLFQRTVSSWRKGLWVDRSDARLNMRSKRILGVCEVPGFLCPVVISPWTLGKLGPIFWAAATRRTVMFHQPWSSLRPSSGLASTVSKFASYQ